MPENDPNDRGMEQMLIPDARLVTLSSDVRGILPSVPPAMHTAEAQARQKPSLHF